MSEYAITGKYAVAIIIKELLPYLKIKKELGQFILKIIKEEEKIFSIEDFFKICEMVDDMTVKFTYSKKRKITSLIVKQYFNSL